ncbi:MAG: hypothetical protein EA426_11995 [Spirochaetaceae bacterium]|nr:MAG: hypothetical protein EA426_11995 [Spirochaetaceae bacterium]
MAICAVFVGVMLPAEGCALMIDAHVVALNLPTRERYPWHGGSAFNPRVFTPFVFIIPHAKASCASRRLDA